MKKKARILVVDDEKSILELVSEFLSKFPYQVESADSVDKALSLIKKNKYDIILTDKNIPDSEGNIEGGITLLKFAKKHLPSTEIIMFTGYATMETAVEAMRLGAFDYIMKPVPLDELKEKIDRIIEYKKFIKSDITIQVYKALHCQALELLENRDNIPEAELYKLLKTLGTRIDHLFGMQKEYDTIIKVQAEALEKIETYVEFLKEAVPAGSPYFSLIEKISVETKKRI